MKGVVVTGAGLVTSLRPFEEMDVFWKALCSGEDAIKRTSPPLLELGREWLLSCIDMPEMRSKFGYETAPENKIVLIAEEALKTALADAGLSSSEAGICLGTVLGNILLKEKRLLTCGGTREERAERDGESLPCLASHLARRFNFPGSRMTISTACASGTDAIGIAARKISSGSEEIMAAGGADVVSDFAITGFHALQALTEEKVRPFDRNRSGLALGEGAAFVVLESERHAMNRGARIYGRLLGYASRSDAAHLTAPQREGRGLTDAIGRALAEAGTAQDGIGYINAHGTGTVYNDLMETKAIKQVFGRKAYDLPVSSTKSMLGHSFGAAGAIEAICCLLAIRDGIIPPTINLQEKDPECDLDYVPNMARRQDVRAALSLSAGFGGQNSALLFGEA